MKAPLNIGLTDASRRTPDMPLYTLRRLSTGDTVQTTGPSGTALFPIIGYNPQSFVLHSGTAYITTTLTWQQPPTMTLTMNASSVVPPAGVSVTVLATLLDQAGQPVPNQPVHFQTIGPSTLQLSAAEAWTNSSGIATTTVNNTGSEPIVFYYIKWAKKN